MLAVDKKMKQRMMSKDEEKWIKSGKSNFGNNDLRKSKTEKKMAVQN